MRLIGLAVALSISVLAASLAGEAQQTAGKVFRVGTIIFGAPETAISLVPFRQRLNELGYIEGQSIVLEVRYARGKQELLPALAAELVRLRVDAIYVAGDQVILAAKEATTTIPIVMVACDAVAAGLIASLSRPGGNITGITCLSSEISGKRLELLREASPNVSRLGVVWNAGDPGKAIEWRNTEVAARAVKMTPTSLEVRGPDDFNALFTATTRPHSDAFMVLGDALTITNRRRIAELVARSGIPAMYGYREFVEAGGLMSYGPHLPDMYRRAADHVDKVLRGAKPADLPVEQPTKFEFVINLKTAKTLGLTIPQSLLQRADQVIE
jgi:putative tryptophan/tyrosine transport system substrate-binding protein